jgi:hypothetical protein
MAGKVGMRSDLPTTLPARYVRGFPWRLDKRCAAARDVSAFLGQLWLDLGGVEGLSVQELALCERATFIRHRILAYESAVLHNSLPLELRGADKEDRPLPMTAGEYSNHANVLVGLLKSLGLKRRPRDVGDLQSYLRTEASKAVSHGSN